MTDFDLEKFARQGVEHLDPEFYLDVKALIKGRKEGYFTALGLVQAELAEVIPEHNPAHQTIQNVFKKLRGQDDK
jgi:hypothetical protein